MKQVSPWIPQHQLDEISTERECVSWMNERGSITARLGWTFPGMRVDVISQGIDLPQDHEAERLGVDANVPCWVREVTLHLHNRRLVHGRTVIPGWGPGNPWFELQALGNQPLGHILFNRTDLERSEFEFCKTTLGAAFAQAHGEFRPTRRCMFLRDGAPLLLTEAFDLLAARPREILAR